MISLVVFDLDGLLLDTEKYNVISKIEEAKKIGYTITKDVVVKSFGMCIDAADKYFKDIYGEAFEYKKIRGKRINYILKEIKEHGLPLKPGVNELLSYLKTHNIKTGIATTSPRAFIDEYMKYDKDFFTQFDYIVTGDEIKEGKPNPEIFLCNCRKANVEPSKTLVCEDSKAGIIASFNGKMKSCFIEDLQPLDDEVKTKATYIKNSLLDVIDIIEEQNSLKINGFTYKIEKYLNIYPSYYEVKALRNDKPHILYIYKEKGDHLDNYVDEIENSLKYFSYLSKLRISLPRIIDHSLIHRCLIYEYIDDITCEDLINNDELDKEILYRLFSIIHICKRHHIMLDFSPKNFVFFKRILYYNCNVVLKGYSLDKLKSCYLYKWIKDFDSIPGDKKDECLNNMIKKYDIGIKR